MSTDRSDPALSLTLPFQITKKIWREVPPELSPDRPENSAAGKIIVITGGGSGIGAGSAKIWLRAGAEAIVIAGRRKDVLETTKAELEKLAQEEGKMTRILTVPTDITREADTANLFEQAKKTFGRTADVVLSNAGAVSAIRPPHKESIEKWWSVYEINVLGTHNLAMSFVKSQSNPDQPIGTFISVNTNLSGMLFPGVSAYSTSKLAVQRYVEYLDIEYPTLRVFSVLPGLVATDMARFVDSSRAMPNDNTGNTEVKQADAGFLEYCLDKPEQTGAMALYLASPRAEYLRGSLTSINWDIPEMEEHKDEIDKGLLKIKYIPVFPGLGEKGLEKSLVNHGD